MLVELAFRNVKRQIGNYLIYFITVTLTVALMFAVSNAIFSPELQAKAESVSEMRAGLIAVSVFVSLIIAFVLSYTTSFMLRLRKREFGTYLTLGMTRKNILTIFVLETMIMGIAALAVGLIIGLFLYQGLMLMIIKLLDTEFKFSSYSLKGLLLTVTLVAGVFILSSLTSAFYLKKTSVSSLIYADKISEKSVKHPIIWAVITIFMLLIIIGSCVYFYIILKNMILNQSDTPGFFFVMFALAVSVILYHIGLSKCSVYLFLKNKKFCHKDTNIFLLRQLSAKLSSNAVIAGIISFLITFAIIGSNVSFLMKITNESFLKRDYPFDIISRINGNSEISLEKGKEIISKYTQIESETNYIVYDTEKNYLHSFTKWSGEGYEGLTDCVYSESEINKLYSLLGIKPIELKGGFSVIADSAEAAKCDFTGAELNLNGVSYDFRGIITDKPSFFYDYFIAVVPDEAVKGLSIGEKCAVFTLSGEKFDAVALHNELTYDYSISDSYSYKKCDFIIKEYGRAVMNSQTAVITVSIMYMAIVFIFMALAVLALKTLSNAENDRNKFQILNRLGTDKGKQGKTLFREIFIFFFLPFILPAFLSIPTEIICKNMMLWLGFNLNKEVLLSNLIIIVILTAIYFLYFTAAYVILKRRIVQKDIVRL